MFLIKDRSTRRFASGLTTSRDLFRVVPLLALLAGAPAYAQEDGRMPPGEGGVEGAPIPPPPGMQDPGELPMIPPAGAPSGDAPIRPGTPRAPMGNASSVRNQNNASAKGQARLESGEKITLNLKDADLGAVISTVSELTGKNFIVDPRVKGKVTVISSRPLTKDAVYQVFLSVLNVQGFAVVPGRGASKIVPIVNAKQDAVPTVTSRAPGRGDEYITRVIQVQNVSVAQLVPILRPLLSQQAHLAAYPPSNVLIASGEAANVDRLVKLINRIDTAGDEAVDIVPLAHASAPEIVRILQSVEKATEKDQAAVGRPTLVADERTNSIIVSGGPEQRVRLRTLITQLDSPSEKSGNTEVVYLKNAKAKDLAAVLTGMSGSFTGAAGKDGKPAATPTAAGKENLAIQADEATNALVISAAPDVMRSIKSVIRQLDVRRAQVLVEAVIAEVSVNRAKEFGVQWGYDGSTTNNPVGLINFGGSGSGIVSVAAAVLAENPAGVNLDGASLFAGDTQPNGDRFGAFVRALAGDGDTNILSTPSLVTMDNEEAEIVVGQNVPFVTGSYSSTSSGAGSSVSNPFQTIQRQDVGLTLKVRPQINEGNAVKLVVNQEVSSLTSGTSGAADLITNKRSLKTTVMVDSGQVLVLGGLIDETLTQSEQKVPLLGDIPILGWLFSYKKTTKEKRNLMVFLHPTILRDEVQNATVSGDKYTYMRARQLDMRERGVKLMSDNESPLLPELQDLMMLPPPFKAGVTPEKPAETPVTPAAPAQQNGAR